jgi:arsenate reductase
MAEGWARHLKGDEIEAHSAGTSPHGMNPDAVKVMAETGVDISRQHSKHIDELKDTHLDYVVTVCDNANETCPVLAGNVKRIHVGFDDPPRLAQSVAEADKLQIYRRVRDEIRAFIERLPQGLTECDA